MVNLQPNQIEGLLLPCLQQLPDLLSQCSVIELGQLPIQADDSNDGTLILA